MATDPMPIPPAQPQAIISAFGRITGVLFSPKATFEDIVRKPSWLLPVVLLTLFGAAIGFGLNQKVNWREFMMQQMEQSPRTATLSAEQKEAQIEAGAKFAPYSAYFFGMIAPVVLVLVVAGIMLGAYNLFAGAATSYKTALGVVSHAYVPLLVSNLLFLLILFLKPAGTLDLDNPVATNLASFFPDGSPKWLEAFGKNVDIFLFWILILIAAGFAAVNPKKLRGAKPYTIAFGMFAIYIVLRMGISFISS